MSCVLQLIIQHAQHPDQHGLSHIIIIFTIILWTFMVSGYQMKYNIGGLQAEAERSRTRRYDKKCSIRLWGMLLRPQEGWPKQDGPRRMLLGQGVSKLFSMSGHKDAGHKDATHSVRVQVGFLMLPANQALQRLQLWLLVPQLWHLQCSQQL